MLGQKLKAIINSLWKAKAKTHKLGQNPTSLNRDILTDPEVEKVIEQVGAYDDLDNSNYTEKVSSRQGSCGRTL